MIPGDSHGIRDFFEDLSRDITPVPVRHAAHVLYAPVSKDPEVTKRCASVLSWAEQQRAERFRLSADRSLFIQRRAFRRFCGALSLGSSQLLSRIVFEETEKGRPYLSDRSDLWFSFSSCSLGFLGAWSSRCEIGVDIEDRTRNPGAIELARQYFSVAEVSAIESRGDLNSVEPFFKFWTLKEAALKSIGEGLPFGLNAFEFELDPHLRIVQAPSGYGGSEKFSAHVIDGLKACTAMVVRNFDD
ncbi:MAG: 4'-phosphopantetheinyl transferase superfamily protein [Halioglobus sp.]